MEFQIPLELKELNSSHEIASNIIKQLKELVSYDKISGIKVNGRKFRLFIALGGGLCYFKKGSHKKGYFFIHYLQKEISDNGIDNVKISLIEKKVLTTDDKLYKLIDKYRRYAEKSTFINGFISQCKSLPKTKDEWLNDGKKELYKYGVTTGVSNEGKVITIDGIHKSISKEYSTAYADSIINPLKAAIKNKTKYISSRFKFRGYEATIETAITQTAGNFCGFLSVEYVGTCNGHYYLLINDECFIYYDKD